MELFKVVGRTLLQAVTSGEVPEMEVREETMTRGAVQALLAQQGAVGSLTDERKS